MAVALTVSNNVTPGQNHHFLNAWVTPMLENIWLFNQCAGKGAPMQTANDKGGSVYSQTEREYIARNLETAAIRMANDLNYWINPAFFTEDIFLGRGRPIQSQIFQARYCKMISLGKRGQTLIQSSVPVVYSDPNNIGVQDTATITVNTSITNDEIKLYFRTTDGAKAAGDYRYEVEPIEVTNNGAGVVTITGHRALFVKPSNWARQYTYGDPNYKDINILDTSDANNFVQAVDVYRVYVDTSDNIELLSADNTLLQTYTGDVIDYELSAFRMGDLCASVCWDKYPAKIRVNYYAGSPLVNSMIDTDLYESLVAYACGLMESKLTKMNYWTLEIWQRWNSYLVETIGSAVVPVATQSQSNSNYGAKRGQIKAWETVVERRIMKAHKFF